MKQETFMMLKPDAFANGKVEEILAYMKAHDLTIEKSKVVNIGLEEMKTLIDHYGQLIESMPKEFDFPGKLFNSFYYDGPHTIMLMKITFDKKEDIIAYTRTLAGATNPQKADSKTIRGKFSDDNYEKAGRENRLVSNVIHASDSIENAKRELAIWNSYFSDDKLV